MSHPFNSQVFSKENILIKMSDSESDFRHHPATQRENSDSFNYMNIRANVQRGVVSFSHSQGKLSQFGLFHLDKAVSLSMCHYFYRINLVQCIKASTHKLTGLSATLEMTLAFTLAVKWKEG